MANETSYCVLKGQGVLSEKLRSFSMQDLTLIRDDDTMHLRSPESRMRTSATGLLETVDDSGNGNPLMLFQESRYQGIEPKCCASVRHNCALESMILGIGEQFCLWLCTAQ